MGTSFPGEEKEGSGMDSGRTGDQHLAEQPLQAALRGRVCGKPQAEPSPFRLHVGTVPRDGPELLPPLKPPAGSELSLALGSARVTLGPGQHT